MSLRWLKILLLVSLGLLAGLLIVFFALIASGNNYSRLASTPRISYARFPEYFKATDNSVDLKVEEPQKNSAGKKIPILVYHYIREVKGSRDSLGAELSVSPQKFVAQLEALKALGFTTVNFEAIKENKLPSRPIILTFDDGYEDFYTAAWPELKKRGMTAVLYVIANAAGPLYVTVPQIQEMALNGIEIGAHTLNHLELDRVNFEKQSAEIIGSKIKLEQILKKNIISLAYPFGRYNDEVRQLTKAAGFDFAVTMKPGIADLDAPFELWRIRVFDETNFKSLFKKY
jgi:peptidoglycan/xylan/chitin deacetylase (PgdA/CDA1 family)